MKSLAGSTWGQDKETLIFTYKAIGRSVLEYGAPIWRPVIKDNNWRKLQTTQNQALRIATENIKMSNQDHLHQESKVIPVKEHTRLISEQFLLNGYLPVNPCRFQTGRVLPDRDKKPTIQSYRNSVDDIVLILDKKDLKKKQKILHRYQSCY